MRSNIALLSDLKAEVSQIKEFIQKPQCSPVQHPNQVEVPQNGVIRQMTVPPPPQVPPAGQWSTPGYDNHTQYSHMFTTQPLFPPPAPWRRSKCFACQQSNNEDCKHCFRCGSNEHYSASCRMRGPRQFRGGSLNGQGSLQRDRE